MFIDWLAVSQEYDFDLPAVTDVVIETLCRKTGERLSSREPHFKHEGSWSTSITINVQGRRISVEGNPSRIDRADNLFGYETIEQCIAVYNRILADYGLPPFSRCTTTFQRQVQRRTGKWDEALVSDGAVIHAIHLTSNHSVGKGNVLAYLRGLSSQSIGRNKAFLFPNGRTVTWTTKADGKGARLMYRKAYDKAFDIADKLLPKVKRLFGEHSEEYAYVQRVQRYCEEQGVVRFEQELKAEYLKREHLAFWGLFDEGRFKALHSAFLEVDQRLKVNAMDMVTIAQQLVIEGICSNTKAANTTAMYAHLWMNGQSFDLTKKQVQTHRARLNRIGIDIGRPCDLTRFSPVIVREIREVTRVAALEVPNWYRRPAGHLQLVAA
ncbi:Phage X family protein [compost metagenome]